MSLSSVFLQAIVVFACLVLANITPAQDWKVQSGTVEVASSSVEEIPLKKVWSNSIPGTRDIFELEPNAPLELMEWPRKHRDYRSTGNTLTFQISTKLDPMRSREFLPKVKLSRPKMFAVLGHGEEALRAACGVLVDGNEPQRVFSRGDNITLVQRQDQRLGLV